MMWRILAGALVVALLVAPGAVEAKKVRPAKKKVKTSKPELHLTADLQAGFAPLTIHFTARLANVAPDSEAFCHAGSFLMLAGLDKPRVVSGQDAACLHPSEEKEVVFTFSHSFTVTRAGYYEFLAMVKTNDGLNVFSNSVPVRVLSSPGGR